MDTSPDTFKQLITAQHPDGMASDGRAYKDIPAPELIKMVVDKYPTGITKTGVSYSSYLPQQKTGGFGSSISDAFQSGVGQIKQGFQQGQSATNPLQAIESGVTFGAGLVNTAFSPLAPIFSPISKGVNAVANKVSDIPAVQNFAMSKAGQNVARGAEDIGNLSTIAGAAAGFAEGGEIAPKVGETVNTATGLLKTTGENIKSGLENKYVASTAKDWERVGGDYVKTDRLLNLQEAQLKNPNAPASAHDTPSFLAQHGISPQTIAEGGKFSPERINQVTEHLTGSAVKPFENTLTKQLEVAQQGQPFVTSKELRAEVSKNINNTQGLTEGDRVLMNNKANREIIALENKYPKGIPLDKLNELKGTYWRNTKFDLVDKLKPQVNHAIGSAMKDIIETKAGSDANIREMNGLLGNYYKSAKFLRGLEGRVPKATLGQKVGRAVVKAGATAIGEKAFGIGGGVGGFLLGKSISHVLENASNPLKSFILNNLKESNPKAYIQAIQWLGQKEAERLSRPLLEAPKPLGSDKNPIIPPAPTTYEPQAENAFRSSSNKTGDIFQRNLKTGEMNITPNKSIKTFASKDPQSLAQEAQKYKSAEEFVKAQMPAYHGSPVELKQFHNKSGAFFTDNFPDASGFGGNPDHVYEGYLDLKKPLVIDAKGAKWDELNTKYGKSTQEVVSNAQKDGYDGIVFKNIVDNIGDTADHGGKSTISYVYKPKDAFLNESQLTDLWNKVKGSPSSKGRKKL